MPATDNIKKLFTVSGCIAPEGMQRYIDGTLTAAEKELIDAHIGICELCTDAIGGYLKHNNPSKASRVVLDINRQLHQKFLRIQTKKARERSMVSVFSAAATIILITGLLYLMKQREIYRERLLAYSLQDSITISGSSVSRHRNYIDESANLQKKAEQEILTETMPTRAITSGANINNKQKSEEFRITAAADEPVEELQLAIVNPRSDSLHIAEITNAEIDINVVGYAAKGTSMEKKKSFQSSPADSEADNAISDEVFIIAEEMPGFMGGDINRFREYVQQHITYPAEAAKAGIEGKVFVSFVINKKGKLVKPEIVRSVDPLLDKEALRVISSSPEWTPGMQQGKPVNVQLVIPVLFKLQHE